jgi:hypothetical protein
MDKVSGPLTLQTLHVIAKNTLLGTAKLHPLKLFLNGCRFAESTRRNGLQGGLFGTA